MMPCVQNTSHLGGGGGERKYHQCYGVVGVAGEERK